jgi:hypothetical protein
VHTALLQPESPVQHERGRSIMLDRLLLTVLSAAVLALPAAASHVLAVDNFQAIKISLSEYCMSEMYRIEQ